MVRENEVRRNEVPVKRASAAPAGAQIGFIGVIRTPWTSRLTCPRQGRADGPVCEIEICEPWVPALAGVGKWVSSMLIGTAGVFVIAYRQSFCSIATLMTSLLAFCLPPACIDS